MSSYSANAMDFHSEKTVDNSSNETRSVLICPEKTNFVWDLTETTVPWILVAVVSISSVATILLNSLVIIAVIQSKQLQRISYILLSSLAVTDLLVGAIIMPLCATVDVLIALQKVHGVCTLDFVNVHLMYLIFASSLHHLTLIAWERYVVIQKWMDYRTIVTRSRMKKLAIGAWFAALLTTLPGILLEAIGTDPKFEVVWLNIKIALVAAALILIVYFYIMVYIGARKRKLSQISQVSSLVSAKYENKVAKTAGLITVALFFSFLPATVVGALGNFFPTFRKNWAFRLGETLMQLNSLVNPCIYCYRDRRFRNALLLLLRLRKPRATQPTDGAARFVRRKKQLGSLKDVAEKHSIETCTARLARAASCDSSLALDYAPGITLGTMLKRSTSAPSLYKGSSFSHHSQHHQRTCSNVTRTANIHDARRKPDVAELQTEKRRSGVMKLKRSMSTPSLAEGNSSCHA